MYIYIYIERERERYTGSSFPFVLRDLVSNNCSRPNCFGKLGVSLRLYRKRATKIGNENKWK